MQHGVDEQCLIVFLQQQRVLVNVHGHVHNGWGMSKVLSVPIINPGSLKYVSRLCAYRDPFLEMSALLS